MLAITFPQLMGRTEAYLKKCAGSLDRLTEAIEASYGKDRTFSVPINMMLALSGRLGPDGWEKVRPLPFELAALPRGFFRDAPPAVVSYALPALIAIGQAIHARSGRFHPLRTLVRGEDSEPAGQITTLQRRVSRSVAADQLRRHEHLQQWEKPDHIVAQRGVSFLKGLMRPDGSWPIDNQSSHTG